MCRNGLNILKPSSINDPQINMNSTMDDPPSSTIVEVVVNQWQSSGADAISAKICKVEGLVFIHFIY